MLTLPRLLLDLDKTASLPANYIELEEHTTIVLDERLIRLEFGAFFSEDFELFAVASDDSNVPLTYGTHYRFIEFDPRASADSGREVWNAVLTLDPDLAAKLRVTYRAYGGPNNGNHKAFAWAVEHLPQAGSLIAYKDILLRPKGLPPKPHPTESGDLFGLSTLVRAVNLLISAIENAPDGRREAVLEYHRVSRIQSQVDVGVMNETIKNHMQDRSNPHGETAETIGLGNVENRSFQDRMDEAGNFIEGYASPSRTRVAATRQLGQRLRLHALEKGNVHNDTASTVGLGNLINAPVHIGYGNSGTNGSYASTYINPTQQVYVGPYSLTNFVAEHTGRFRTGGLGTSISDFLTQTNQALQETAQAMIRFNANYVLLGPKLQAISANVATVDARLGQFTPEEIEYRLLNFNSCYAEFLKEVVIHRAETDYNTYDTLMPIPQLVAGLESWVDFSDASAMVIETNVNVDAPRKIKAISDKRVDSNRVFAQSNATAQPLWQYSQDRATPNSPGMVLRKVAKFNAGVQHLTLRQGPAIEVLPTSTVLVLVRTGATGTSLWPLMKKPSSPTFTATEGLIVHGESRRLAKVLTDDQRMVVNTPAQSSVDSKTTLVVLSLNAGVLEHSWASGRIVSDTGVYPRNLQGLPLLSGVLSLDQIGINKSSFLQEGELAEFMVYRRQLSLREVKALAFYLQRKHGGEAGFPIEVAFVQTAFEAPQSLI